MKGKFAVAALVLAIFASAGVAFAAEPDAGVKGLWLKCRSFPSDAEVLEFTDMIAPWDENLSAMSQYTRSIDGLLTFELRRQTIEESQLQMPEDVPSLIEMHVWNDEVDEDIMKTNWDNAKINTNASEFAAMYTYPCATAEYLTGQNEDTRHNVSLFIFTDVYCFVVAISVGADWYEDYEERIQGWLKGLEFVEN